MSFPGNRHQCLVTLAGVLKFVPELKGRIRIQKALYLLKRCGMTGLRRVGFDLQSYGPFSPEVASALQEGVAAGYFTEDAQSPGEDWQNYSYRLNKDGEELAAEIDVAALGLIDTIAKRVAHEHWLALELASTIDFVAQEEKISQAQAIERVVSLKPSTGAYLDKAVKVLEDLSLVPLQETAVA
jgi:uncharacterized protein YwgA